MLRATRDKMRKKVTKYSNIFMITILIFKELLGNDVHSSVLKTELAKAALRLPDNFFVSRNSYTRLMREADDLYQSGYWKESMALRLASRKIQQDELHSRSLQNLDFKIIGSNFTDSIGHLAIGLSARVKAQVLNVNRTKNKFIILKKDNRNEVYLQLWSKYFKSLSVSTSEYSIIESLLWPLFEDISFVNIDGKESDLYESHNQLTLDYLEKNPQKPLLDCQDVPSEEARIFLEQHGIDLRREFITLHVRDPEIGGELYGRNAEISTYLEAIKYLTSEGYSVIRVGDKTVSSLPLVENFLDLTMLKGYENQFDIFLLSACKFHIGTTSGPLIVPHTFGKPVLATNAPDIARFVNLPMCLVLPKKVKRNDVLLSLRDILESGAGHTDGYLEKSQAKSSNWISNSPSEIVNGVIEMLSQAYLHPSRKQIEIQQQISQYGFSGKVTIAQSFINSNLDMFD